jgi:predicted ATPase
MLEPGQVVDRYVVRRLLGRGGMADVWLAEHEVLHTPVALKVLHGAPSPQLRERLLREGRVQAGLRHPGIVRVLDVVEVDGHAALVLDWVDGPSLHDVLQRGPLPLDRVERLVGALVEALEAAHAAGVVHRDLKPANVLLADGDAPRITDFGLAAVLDGAGQRLTRAGAGLGTPHYMAPELVDDARTADRRADVFALGVLTYELLVGAPPAEGPALSVLHRMAHGRWSPATERVPGLPPRVDDALRWALAPDRADRAPTAAAFFDRLRGEPAPAVATAARRTPEPSPRRASAHTLPSSVRALLGREEVLGRVEARLRDLGGVVVLTGPPGVGKTRLATELAGRWRDVRGEQGVTWVDLSPAEGAEAAEQLVTAAVGPPGGTPLAPALARRGAHLLVLDNLEHLTRELGPWIDALVAAAPSLRVLATSREAPGLAREVVEEVAPLPVEAPDPRETAAWRILVGAAPAGALDAVTPEVAGRLLAALDGLPLCLELAGARLEVLEPEELLSRLASPTRVLRVPGAEGRHDALSETLAWSWSLLRPEEQRALAWLSTFRGSFPLVDAEALLDRGRVVDGLDALHGLVRRNLVRREHRRFRLLRAIRDFADRQLGADALPARVAHAEVVVPQGLAARDASSADRLRLGSTLASELEAVVAGREVPALAGFLVEAAAGLTSLYHDTGTARAVRRVASEGLSRAAVDHPARFGLLVSRGLASRRLADDAATRRDLDEALAVARTDRERATALVHLADLILEQGQDAEARARYLEALALARRSGPPHLVVSACASLATATTDRAEADRWLAESRAAIPEDDPLSRFRWAKASAWVALNRDDVAEGAERYAEVRTLAVSLGDRRAEGYATGQLGLVAEARGDLAAAERDLATAAARFTEEGDASYAAFYRGALGRVLARSGRWAQAGPVFGEAAAASREPFAAGFRRWAAVAAAHSADVVAPDDRWGWLFAALAARRSRDRVALREALAVAPPLEATGDGPLLAAVLAQLREEAGAWRIAADGTRAESPEGAVVDLGRHAANARILARLLAERLAGGRPLDVASLTEAGWPGERIVPSAAANRVRVALSALRRAGLDDLVERSGGGWRLRTEVPVVRT